MLATLGFALGVLHAMSFMYFAVCLFMTIIMSSPPPGSGPPQWRAYASVIATLSVMVMLNAAMAGTLVAGSGLYKRRHWARKLLLLMAPIVMVLAVTDGWLLWTLEAADPFALTMLGVIGWPSIVSGLGYSVLVIVVLLQKRVTVCFT
jgi:hypothetical protein